ncbi:hypothetical protein D9M68_598660 [compost metagenome]
MKRIHVLDIRHRAHSYRGRGRKSMLGRPDQAPRGRAVLFEWPVLCLFKYILQADGRNAEERALLRKGRLVFFLLDTFSDSP